MKITDPKTLSHVLKEYRKEQGLSQAALADRVGLRQGTVSNFETAPEKMQLDTLFRILSALEIELAVQPRNTPLQPDDWPEAW